MSQAVQRITWKTQESFGAGYKMETYAKATNTYKFLHKMYNA